MFKKGMSLGNAAPAVLMLVIIGTVAVVGIKINDTLITSEGNVTATSNYAQQAAGNATSGIQQITQNLTLIGIIVVMAIVIGLLFSAFGGTMNNTGGL